MVLTDGSDLEMAEGSFLLSVHQILMPPVPDLMASLASVTIGFQGYGIPYAGTGALKLDLDKCS